MTTVSARLLEEHGMVLRPGAKGTCPFCQHATFSLKPDDTLGKCFHPACGQVLTVAQTQGQRSDLARFLGGVYRDFHAELLALASGQHNAYTYLRDERGIHPTVIAEAMLGAVPAAFDVMVYAQPLITEAEEALQVLKSGKVGRPTKAQQHAQERLDALTEATQRLHDCLTHHAGWLVFVYTTAAHQPCALRLREPYAKRFVSFKPGRAGLFGRDLFTPYTSPERQDVNDFLIIVEGEFNALQLQSVALHAGQSYVNACAVGSVTTADTTTLARVTEHPVVVYDHDAHKAGFELVKAIQKTMPVEATTTPEVDSDLDSYLCDFGQDYGAAWEGVKALIAAREPHGRTYSLTGEEFFDYPVTRGTKVFTPRLLGKALMQRETYAYAAERLWVYKEGVYKPCGTTTLRREAQALLGNERRAARVEEAFQYVQVATQVTEEGDTPDSQYINLRNGRLNWKTGERAKHTSDAFTTVQLPFAYDETARCEAFDAYLASTFDADMAPLIAEVLGWCLVPDRRFEKSIMLVGEGENGKSVFLDLVRDLLGPENVSHVALQDLEESRFKAAQLYGKLANLFADLDARALVSSTMFKTLTTGDPIDAERKFTQGFPFRSYAKLLFSANKIPPSRDRTHAFYRRWIIIPFTRTFDGQGSNPKPDKGLRAKLAAELPGIFNLALAGLRRLHTAEAFSETESTRQAKQAYILSNDNMREFLEECVVAERNATIGKHELRRVYDTWCELHGLRPAHDGAIKAALKEAVPWLDECRLNKYSPREWLGVMWSADAEPYRTPKKPEAEAEATKGQEASKGTPS